MAEFLKNAPDIEAIVTPGELIADYLDALNMSQTDLAARTGLSKKTVNEIMTAKAGLTPLTAIRLEKVLGRPAHFWNNLETNYRDHLASAAEREHLAEAARWLKTIPVAELVKRGCLSIKAGADLYAKLTEVLKFYGVASISAWEEVWKNLDLAARKDKKAETLLGPATAWIRQGQILASQLDCGEYDQNRFRDVLRKIRHLTVEEIEVSSAQAQKLCAGCGVAVVYVPEMKKVPWNGVTTWLAPNKPLIILSIRGRGEDRFWFSFFHEAAHVLHEDKKKSFLINYDDYRDAPEEKRADKFAGDFLAPPPMTRGSSKSNPARK
ncbi:MAG: HigA family addiction module antidote protein [Candidatus Adiutrix sp.]|jgi:addiction module HigA family antidote|nr:HigA family addiction module antidote protein [Candidatus Adiutrix sp.]